MAASIADVVLNYTWKDINAATGIAAGTEIIIQNKSPRPIFVWLGASAPTTPNAGFRIDTGGTSTVDAGEPKVWVFGTGNIYIQS